MCWISSKKYSNDTRHSGIIILSQEPIEERQFADWKMAFVNLDDETLKSEPAYSEFLRNEFTADVYRSTPRRAYLMLLTFKENMR